MGKRGGWQWPIAALAASTVLTSACAAPVDTEKLPGLYRSDKTGGEILLNQDGTFTATDISAVEAAGGGSTAPLAFDGEWKFVDKDSSSDFVYLTIKDDGLGTTAGVQLYPEGAATVEFYPDPDGPPSLVLTKAAAP